MAFKDVMSLRKSGNNQEAYEKAIEDYRQAPDDVWAKRALAWCIYDGLKVHASCSDSDLFVTKLTELKELDVPASEDMLWNNVAWPINAFVRDCSKTQNVNKEIYDVVFEGIRNFHFVKPSKEYSVILNAFLNAKEWEGIIAFCDWWNFENFRAEDYESELLPNGKRMPLSLVESAYIAYAKELINKGDNEAIVAFVPRLQELAERYPKMQYPNYYVGKLLLASGSDKQEAVAALLPFARKKQSEYWVWQLLAEAFEEDDEKCMACLLRAAHCNTPEQYLAKVYQLLAIAFKQLHYYADARFYLDKYFQVKSGTLATISKTAFNMFHETWYAEAAGQNPTYELDYMAITNELIFNDKPEIDAVVSFVNTEKKMVTVVYGNKKEGFFKYDRFIKKLNLGDNLKIRLQEVSADGFMKVLSARVSESPIDTDYCKTAKGSVSSNMSMTTYFLQSEKESFFIPSSIVSKMKLIIGEPVSAIILYSYLKKKDEWKWSCVKVKR